MKAKGLKPKFQGGNGFGPTVPEQILLNHIPEGIYNYVFHLKEWGRRRYLIDVAIPSLKVAIEADGSSHQKIVYQESDKRKDAALTKAGWIVLRFKNEEIINHTTRVIEKCQQAIQTRK